MWGLWLSSRAGGLLSAHTELLGFPDGMGFAYSSPLKGLLGRGLVPLIGLVAAFNALAIAARVATVLAAWAAARAWGAGRAGALVAAAAYGCAPFFQGYAVEGIVEGTDGWTLALWAWAVGRDRIWLAPPLLALTLLSSWYLGAAAMLLCLLAAPWRPRVLVSLLGVGLAAPALWAFLSAFPDLAPLDGAVRAAMGTSILPRPPGVLPGLQPFALTSWIGLVVPILVLAGRQRLALLALVPWVLSLGLGPWYDLPGLELLRFPYRLHAASLAILALAAARATDRFGAAWLAPLIVVEGLLLSPIEPLLPGAPTTVPAIYAEVDGPLLELPGPVSLPPGLVNPSRPRARYLLYFQAAHGQPSPWVPGFNAVGVTQSDRWLSPLAAWDPLVSDDPPDTVPAELIEGLAAAGLTQVMVQHEALGRARAAELVSALVAAGAEVQARDGARTLLHLQR